MNKRGCVCSLCNFPKNRKGQVTVFIILAIIIIAAALLIYSFYPQIKTTLSTEEQNPASYIQSCIEDNLRTAVDTISIQGGSINPENFVLYDDTNVEFLCYTGEYYRPCVLQQPMLKQHIESEIKKDINDEVNACFDSLRQSYDRKGYSVELKTGEKMIGLFPNKIVGTFNYSVVLTKGDDIQKYDSFVVLLNNNLYELSSIANSILGFESVYGDAETTTYMTYYHDLKVEKKFGTDGAKIYILTDRNTGDKFQFAVRSQVWPAGYWTGG